MFIIIRNKRNNNICCSRNTCTFQPNQQLHVRCSVKQVHRVVRTMRHGHCVLRCSFHLRAVVLFDQQHNDNLVGSQRHSLVMNQLQTQFSEGKFHSESQIILQPVTLKNICPDVFINNSNTLVYI